MRLRPLHFIGHQEDDLDLGPADLAVAPAVSNFMWGLVGSDAFPVSAAANLPQVSEPELRPDVPGVAERPSAWALESLGSDSGAASGSVAEVWADVPNPADLVGDPLWTEVWGQPSANVRALPSLVTGQTAADLSDREHAISELCQQIEGERSGKPVLPPSDPLDGDAWDLSGANISWTDNVSLVGSTRQEGPDVSLLSSNGWI